jgi:hypothetical protein
VGFPSCEVQRNKVESADSAVMETSEIPGRSTKPPINQAAEEIEQSTPRRRSESSWSSESESSSSSESDNRKNRKIRRLERRLSEMERRSRFPTQGDEKTFPGMATALTSCSETQLVPNVN